MGSLTTKVSLGTVTFGACESAEFIARRSGCNAAQDRAGLAVLAARALYDAKRRAGCQCMRAEHVRHPCIRRVHDTLPDTGL